MFFRCTRLSVSTTRDSRPELSSSLFSPVNVPGTFSAPSRMGTFQLISAAAFLVARTYDDTVGRRSEFIDRNTNAMFASLLLPPPGDFDAHPAADRSNNVLT